MFFMINKNQYSIKNTKKHLIKTRKGWMVASALMLAVLGYSGVQANANSVQGNTTSDQPNLGNQKTSTEDTNSTLIDNSQSKGQVSSQNNSQTTNPQHIQKQANNMFSHLVGQQLASNASSSAKSSKMSKSAKVSASSAAQPTNNQVLAAESSALVVNNGKDVVAPSVSISSSDINTNKGSVSSDFINSLQARAENEYATGNTTYLAQVESEIAENSDAISDQISDNENSYASSMDSEQSSLANSLDNQTSAKTEIVPPKPRVFNFGGVADDAIGIFAENLDGTQDPKPQYTDTIDFELSDGTLVEKYSIQGSDGQKIDANAIKQIMSDVNIGYMSLKDPNSSFKINKFDNDADQDLRLHIITVTSASSNPEIPVEPDPVDVHGVVNLHFENGNGTITIVPITYFVQGAANDPRQATDNILAHLDVYNDTNAATNTTVDGYLSSLSDIQLDNGETINTKNYKLDTSKPNSTNVTNYSFPDEGTNDGSTPVIAQNFDLYFIAKADTATEKIAYVCQGNQVGAT